MALKIRTIGNPDLIGDIQPGWSIDENATPHAIGDGSASVGGVQFSAGRRGDSEFLLNKPVTVYYEPEGTVASGNNVTGVFDSVDASGGGVGVTSTNLLSRLTAERSIRPTLPPAEIMRKTSVSSLGATYPRPDTITELTGAIIPQSANDFVKINDKLEIINRFPIYLTSDAGDYAVKFDFDLSGNLYVIYNAGRFVRKFSSTGVYISQWGSSGSGNGQFNSNVYAIKFNKIDGNLYVLDLPGQVPRVQVFSTTGIFIRSWLARSVFPDAENSGINDLACDSSGNIIVDKGSAGYIKYDRSGNFIAKTPWRGSPFGVRSFDVDQYGNLAISVENKVHLISPNGDFFGSYSMGEFLGSGATSGICFTADGTIFSCPQFRSGFLAENVILTGSPKTVRGYFYTLLSTILPINSASFSGANPPAVYPGWTDSVWAKLNELCAATGKEIVLQNDAIIVRDVASTTVGLDNFIGSPQRSAEKGSGRHVEVVNQNTSVVSGGVVFDYRRDQGRTFSVDVNEVNTTNLNVDTWLVSVQQPVPALGQIGAYVAQGSYTVLSSDGLFVPPALWQRGGGSLFVEVAENGTSIDVTTTGPTEVIPGYQAPYTVGSIVGTNRSTGVSILGSGVAFSPQVVRVATGADWSIVSEDVSQTINQPFITDLATLYDRAEFATPEGNGTAQVLSFSIPMSDIGGLGLTAGAMFLYNKAWWRIRSSKIGNAAVNITALCLTTVGQHDAVVAGETIGAHDTRLAALTLGDSALKPLY